MITRIIVAVIVASVASSAFAATKKVSKIPEPSYFTHATGNGFQ